MDDLGQRPSGTLGLNVRRRRNSGDGRLQRTGASGSGRTILTPRPINYAHRAPRRTFAGQHLRCRVSAPRSARCSRRPWVDRPVRLQRQTGDDSGAYFLPSRHPRSTALHCHARDEPPAPRLEERISHGARRRQARTVSGNDCWRASRELARCRRGPRNFASIPSRTAISSAWGPPRHRYVHEQGFCH